MPPINPSSLAGLWRQPPSSPLFQSWISDLCNTPTIPQADVKSYPDEVYHNYYPLGISLTFTPSSFGSQNMGLDRIDLYNQPSSSGQAKSRRPRGPAYTAPSLPVTFHFPTDFINLPPQKAGESSSPVKRPIKLDVVRQTKGRQLVACFGEPSKKSEGKIIGDLGTGLWMEWDRVELLAEENLVVIGIMVELRNPGSNEKLSPEQQKHGAGGVWDRAANWEWSCLKLFDPSAAQRP